MNYCMIEVAFNNLEEVNKVIDILLFKKLGASCQVVESTSSWNYQNIRENSKEYLVFIKTKKELINEIYDVIKAIHSYEVFELAVYDITSPNNDYLKWIDNETK